MVIRNPSAAGIGPPAEAIQLLTITAQPTPTMAPNPIVKKSNTLTPFFSFIMGVPLFVDDSFLFIDNSFLFVDNSLLFIDYDKP